MSETGQLIRQAARELQIDSLTVTEWNEGIAVDLKRRDGSDGHIFLAHGTSFSAIVSMLKAESKSEVSAATAKAKRIAELEAELKELKGE